MGIVVIQNMGDACSSSSTLAAQGRTVTKDFPASPIAGAFLGEIVLRKNGPAGGNLTPETGPAPHGWRNGYRRKTMKAGRYRRNHSTRQEQENVW